MKNIFFTGTFTLLFFQTLLSQSNCSGYFIHFPDDQNTSLGGPYTPDNFGQPQILGNNCDSLSITYWDLPQDFQPSLVGECFEFDRYWTIYNPATYHTNLPCTHIPNPAPISTWLNPANTIGPVLSAPGTNLPGWEPTITHLYPTDPNLTNYSIYWSIDANCYQYTQNFKIFDQQPPIASSSTPGTIIDDTTANDAAFWNHPDWADANTGDHNLSEGPLDFEIIAMDSTSPWNLNFYYRLYLDLDGNGSLETVVNSNNPPGFNNIQYNNATTPGFNGGVAHPFDTRMVPSNQKWGFGLQKDAISGNFYKARVRWYNQSGQDTVPQIPHGTHSIKWVVQDICGNETVLNQVITNQRAFTDSTASVSGRVTDECGTPAPDIAIGPGANSTHSDSNGKYQTGPVLLNTPLDICATESLVGSTFADAVNVCDIVAIQRYILGIAPFSSPYRALASDVNMSGSITDMDIFSIRQALMGHYDLGLVPAPPLKWQLINTSQTFPNPDNPFSAPVQSCYWIPAIETPVTNADFIRFKIGDADASASGCGSQGAPMPFPFYTQQKTYHAGDTIAVSLSAGLPVRALQVVLKVDGLTFWNPFPVNNLNNAVYLADSIAKVTWLDGGTLLDMPSIDLQLIALENGTLSEHLHFFADDYTKATVYTDSCTTIIPELTFTTVPVFEPGTRQALHNYPNPWHTQTAIELDALSNNAGTLQIVDIAGRIVYAATLQLQQGSNRIVLHTDDLTNTGMFFYRIMTPMDIYAGTMFKW